MIWKHLGILFKSRKFLVNISSRLHLTEMAWFSSKFFTFFIDTAITELLINT